MELGTPALVYLATTLAIGGACLGYLKKKYHTTDHHLMIFVMVAALGYMAPLHIQRASDHARERLQLIWVGAARVFAHSIEKLPEPLNRLEKAALDPVIARARQRLAGESTDSRSVTVVIKNADGHMRYVTSGIHQSNHEARVTSSCETMIKKAFDGQEAWTVERDLQGKPFAVISLVPLRDEQDLVEGVLMTEFSPRTWLTQQAHAEWRVAGEFTGVLCICLCLGGILVANSENRRRLEMEKLTRPLKEHLESLDGMVNAVQGVVWERPASNHVFTYVSQQADGYLGYSSERWADEEGFLVKVIHSDDLSRVCESWKQAAESCTDYHIEYRVVCGDGSTAFVTEHGQATKATMQGVILRGILLNITSQRQAEAEVQDMHKMMIEASRQGGMAEIATGVLHNVGNVLNSLNVGAKLLAERLKKSRMDKLCQATQLLKEHLPENPEFFIHDKRGLALPGYLVELSGYLRDEQNRLNATVSDMIERIEHIRDMIMLQQSHSAVRTLWEPLDMATIMEEALRLEMDVHIAHQQVRVERQFADLPPIYSSRGLLLQILVNLFANACQAMGDKPAEERLLTLRIQPHSGDRVKLVVEDSGCGIQPRHLTSIFTQGFTTKSDGHGFGLHHACLLAQDLGGSLKAESDGLGKGARFILDLPTQKKGPATAPLSLSGPLSGPLSATPPPALTLPANTPTVNP